MKGREWTRREFLKKTGSWAGAGLLQPVLSLIGEGKSIATAYPEELLSVEKYTKGRVKPGMVISREEADRVRELCPAGLYMELTRGAQIKIAETTTSADALVPPYWVEATLRNRGQAVLDNRGQLWTRDGRPWIGGDPFPEPGSGLEAMWNHTFNQARYDDTREVANELHIDNSGAVLREGVGFVVRIQTVGRLAVEPKPILPEYQKELYRAMLTLLKPFDVYGLASNTTIYYDAAKLPDTDLYIPTLKRTRRVPSTQRFEPVSPYAVYFISDLGLHNDPLLTWSWKLVGRKPMLGPSPHNRGAFARGAGKDDFIFPQVKEKFPRSTWELRPEMLIVDGASHLEGSPYSRKRMYIDAIYHRAQTANMWDKAGRLWKFSVYYWGDTGVTDNMGATARELTGIVFADLQKDYHSNIFFYPRVEDVDFKVNANFKIEDWNTPSAMLRRGRR